MSGVWHGASWNYVLWGLYHGVLLSSARFLQRWPQPAFARTPAIRLVRIIGTFVLVNIGLEP